MTERTEGDRWFAIVQDRKREWAARARQANKRSRSAARRAEQQQQVANRGIQMERTEWMYDEHGNLSRMIYAANNPAMGR